MPEGHESPEGGSVRLLGCPGRDRGARVGLLGSCLDAEWVEYAVGGQHGQQCLVRGSQVVLSWWLG